MNSTVKHLLIWVVTIACLLVGWQFVYKTMGTGHDKATSLTETLGDAEAGKIAAITVAGTEVTGEYKGTKETSTRPFRRTIRTFTKTCATMA